MTQNKFYLHIVMKVYVKAKPCSAKEKKLRQCSPLFVVTKTGVHAFPFTVELRAILAS